MRARSLQLFGQQIGNKLGTFAARNAGAKLLHQRRGQFKGHSHIGKLSDGGGVGEWKLPLCGGTSKDNFIFLESGWRPFVFSERWNVKLLNIMPSPEKDEVDPMLPKSAVQRFHQVGKHHLGILIRQHAFDVLSAAVPS